VSAKSLQRAGEHQEAVIQFQTALRLDERDFWSMYHMIELGMMAGQTDFASNVLDHALSIYPESPLMLGLKGKFLFSTGQQSEGLSYMIRATEGQPGSLKLWSDLRLLAGLAGQINLAKRADDEIARINRFINR